MDKIYVALDSDIVRHLTAIEPYVKCKDIPLTSEAPRNRAISKYGTALCKLFNKAQADDLRLLVTQTVYHETKHIPQVKNFIETYCYFPSSENLEDENYINNIRTLAYSYCGFGTNPQEKRKYPFNARYVAEFNRYCPCNDSYVMAEATIEGAILLTANQNDFIYIASPDKKNRRIANEIIYINRQLGYNDENGFTPYPIGISELDYFLSTGIKKLENNLKTGVSKE